MSAVDCAHGVPMRLPCGACGVLDAIVTGLPHVTRVAIEDDHVVVTQVLPTDFFADHG